MRNCIILGSGRSGTSLAAGLLAKAGYYMGGKMIATRDANPKGFFEARQITRINEDILARTLWRRMLLNRILGRGRLAWMQHWLAQVPVGTKIHANEAIRSRIQVARSQTPFCFKDPRFCYTLPVWRPHLEFPVFVCVFRDPIRTGNSILKDTKLYHIGVNIDLKYAIRVWELMYEHILLIHAKGGDWLFIHYNQLLQEEGLARLASFTGATVDPTFADPALSRSQRDRSIPAAAAAVYRELCQRAKYNGVQDGSNNAAER